MTQPLTVKMSLFYKKTVMVLGFAYVKFLNLGVRADNDCLGGANTRGKQGMISHRNNAFRKRKYGEKLRK